VKSLFLTLEIERMNMAERWQQGWKKGGRF